MVKYNFKVTFRRYSYLQEDIIYDCIYDWRILNDAAYTYYPNVMNMKTRRYFYKHSCWIALTYHFNLNKW